MARFNMTGWSWVLTLITDETNPSQGVIFPIVVQAAVVSVSISLPEFNMPRLGLNMAGLSD